jgi:copper chaperone CopZ
MFGLFKKKKQGKVVSFKIDGMHCTSCSMNVDGELEDLDGVFSATTSYAKQESVVEYDSTKVTPKHMKAVIEELGYKVV